MDFSVTFLGTSAAIPTRDRGLSATLVRHGGASILVDCGEGTQRQLRRSSAPVFLVDVVLLTHLHGDHFLGLIGLLKSYDLLRRATALHIVGSPGVNMALERISRLVGPLGFEVVIREQGPGEVPGLPIGLRVDAFETAHSVPSQGYRLQEPPHPGTFDVAAARRLGVPAGPLYGRLQRGQTIEHDGRLIRPADVLGPSRRGRSVVLTGDTEPCRATVDAAAGADLLVHEATFTSAQRDRARAVRHSCADEAARVAAEAGVGSLALTHLSQTVSAADLLTDARPVFDRCFVPDDLDELRIPRAEPTGSGSRDL